MGVLIVKRRFSDEYCGESNLGKRLTGLVLSQSFSHVREVDQIPYPMSGNRSCYSLLFVWQAAAAAAAKFPMQPIGTAVNLKSITPAVSHFAFRLSCIVPCAFFFFAAVYLFRNIHPECHT